MNDNIEQIFTVQLTVRTFGTKLMTPTDVEEKLRERLPWSSNLDEPFGVYSVKPVEVIRQARL